MTVVGYLFGFTGRVNRAKWWMLILIQIGAWIVYYTALFMVGGTMLVSIGSSSSPGEAALNAGSSAILIMLLSLGYVVGIFIVWLAVTVKRLHDRDKSGGWIALFALGPWVAYALALAFALQRSGGLAGIFALSGMGISVWAFIELGCLRGTIGENRFGSDPLAVHYVYAAPPGMQSPSAAAMPPVRMHEPAEPRAARRADGTIELNGLDGYSEYYLKIDASELDEMPDGLLLGRASDRCAFSIDDESISRSHARLSARAGEFLLQDTGSTNGTKLNGRRLAAGESGILHSGDRVVLGAVSFRVQIV